MINEKILFKVFFKVILAICHEGGSSEGQGKRVRGMGEVEGCVMVGSGRGDELPTRRARKPGQATAIASANADKGQARSLGRGNARTDR